MDSNDDPFVLVPIDVNGFDIENHSWIMTKAEFERFFVKKKENADVEEVLIRTSLNDLEDKDKEESVCGEK